MRNRVKKRPPEALLWVGLMVLFLSRPSICDAAQYRIVSLAPNATEILFALGLEDSIVAVDRYSDYPEGTRRLEEVGTFFAPDIEKIILMRPDYLLVGASIDHGMAGYLRAIGVEIIKVSPESVDGLCRDILMLGNIFKKVDQATVIVNDIKDRVSKIAGRTGKSKPKVFVQLFNDPLITGSAFIGDVVEQAGGENIAWDVKSDAGLFSYEVLIDRDPDIIIEVGFLGSSGVLESINAMKKVRVYNDLNPDILLRPGPRTIDAIEELNRIFYDKD